MQCSRIIQYASLAFLLCEICHQDTTKLLNLIQKIEKLFDQSKFSYLVILILLFITSHIHKTTRDDKLEQNNSITNDLSIYSSYSIINSLMSSQLLIRVLVRPKHPTMSLKVIISSIFGNKNIMILYFNSGKEESSLYLIKNFRRRPMKNFEINEDRSPY